MPILKKEERSLTNDLNFQLKKLEKQGQIKPQISRLKDIIIKIKRNQWKQNFKNLILLKKWVKLKNFYPDWLRKPKRVKTQI